MSEPKPLTPFNGDPEADAAAKPKRAPRAKPHDDPDAEMVKARVTKKGGEDHISTGEHVAGDGEVYHQKDDIITLPKEHALVLEDRGWVEIQ